MDNTSRGIDPNLIRLTEQHTPAALLDLAAHLREQVAILRDLLREGAYFHPHPPKEQVDEVTTLLQYFEGQAHALEAEAARRERARGG